MYIYVLIMVVVGDLSGFGRVAFKDTLINLKHAD